ncbi:TPA: glycoside-pentoside-hexuronide (GPH):cation symporter [Raoultella planticola]
MNRIMPLNWYQKMGYGLGDTACNLVWSSIMLFMAYFYTDIFGLSPAHMGTMFLAVRVIDAFFDVGIGAVTDRTRTKYGQFRPYLLWFAIPFGVMCMLTFYTPDFSYTGKLIYAYCSYTLLSLLYSAINVPYCAMINNISQSSVERVSLQSWRFAMSSAGGLLVSVAALPAVAWLGKGNIQNGYFYAMVLISSLGIILFYLCFFLTKETSIATIDANRGSLLQDLRILLKNRDWRILFTLNVVNLVAVIFKMGIIIYFCNYVLRRSDLSSMMITISIVSGLAGTILSVYIFRGMDKVRGFKLAMLLEAILLALLYFFSQSSLIIIFAFIIAINFIHLATVSGVDGPVYLRLAIDGKSTRFFWSPDNQTFHAIGQTYSTALFSDEYSRYGEFTGAFVGIGCVDSAYHRRQASFYSLEYRAFEQRSLPQPE